LIGLYIARSAVASPFGAAGTVIIVIVWVYYSAQIFFLGAEFTRHYALRRGSLQQAVQPAPSAPPREPNRRPPRRRKAR
jgi:membrane protein